MKNRKDEESATSAFIQKDCLRQTGVNVHVTIEKKEKEMDSLVNLILGEVAVALVLFILLLLIILWQLLKKYVVTVTVVSVRTDAASYDHGQTVNISGDVTVDGTPQTNTSVSLKITDTAGTEIDLPDATTDADGKFTAAWTIPPEVAPGVCTVSATALGATATATFRLSNTICEWK